MSLPLAGRLESLRIQNQRDPSATAQIAREVLSSLRVSLDALVAGRPAVGGQRVGLRDQGRWAQVAL